MGTSSWVSFVLTWEVRILAREPERKEGISGCLVRGIQTTAQIQRVTHVPHNHFEASGRTEMLNSKLLSLEKISTPSMVHSSLVLDGEEFGLESFAMAAAVRLLWRSNMPEAWQPVVRWAEEMRTFLSLCLADESVSEIAI